MQGLFLKDNRHVYRVVPFLEHNWLEHGFGTRQSSDFSRQAGLIGLKQVHSDVCLYAGDRAAGRIGEGDALVTNVPGVLVSVRTADCLPIFLVDKEKRAVAAIHAGWRGTVQSISSKAVSAMASRFGSRPEDLTAAIGPGIGKCCYEVGAEVAVQFRDLFTEFADLVGRAHLDLPEANRRQLVAAGVPAEGIWLAGLCTCCSPEDFYSYRRERQRSGRMTAAVGIKKTRRARTGVRALG